MTNGYSSPFVISCYSSENVTIYYRVSGTASNGVDYTNLIGRVTIPANVGQTNVFVRPIQDGISEGTETVTVTLVETNGYLIEPSQLSATMLIKDSPILVAIYPYNSAAVETNGPPGSPTVVGQFFLTRTDDTGIYPAMGLRYTMSGTASNGVDYAFLSGVFTFGAGESFTNLDVVPLNDTLVEGIETVILTLQPSNTYVIDTNYSTQTVEIADSTTDS